MKKIRLMLGVISVFALIGCTASQGYRKYGVDELDSELPPVDPLSISFFVSTLESIEPYVHAFPTGIKTEAPNLDPRYFAPPDSIMNVCCGAANPSDTNIVTLSLPGIEYEIIGEVETTLIGEKYDTSNRDRISDEEIEGMIGPNKKAYRRLLRVDWEHAFDDLRKSAAELRADAVIEMFCGKGVSSYWYPPSSTSIPMYGSGGQVVGSYSKRTPGGVGLTGWKVVGLAVRWKKQPDF